MGSENLASFNGWKVGTSGQGRAWLPLLGFPLRSGGARGPCRPHVEGPQVEQWCRPSRPARPLTHPAAPGRSRAPPSFSLSFQGCFSGPPGPSFLSHSSCPWLSSQTALCQGTENRREVVTPNSLSQTQDH